MLKQDIQTAYIMEYQRFCYTVFQHFWTDELFCDFYSQLWRHDTNFSLSLNRLHSQKGISRQICILELTKKMNIYKKKNISSIYSGLETTIFDISDIFKLSLIVGILAVLFIW